MDHIELIETALKYWSVQDVEPTLATFSDDVVYRLNIAPETVGISVPQQSLSSGGPSIVMRGKGAARDMMYDFLAKFDYLLFDPVMCNVRSSVARVQVRYVVRHRATGEELAGSKRYVLKIEDDLVSQIDEYVDAARLSCFLQLAQWRVAEVEKALENDGPRKHARVN